MDGMGGAQLDTRVQERKARGQQATLRGVIVDMLETEAYATSAYPGLAYGGYTMKQGIIVTLGLLAGLWLVGSAQAASTWVDDYWRKDGTYVPSHERTLPDRRLDNNYGYPGNYHPNRGSFSTGDPLSYEQRQQPSWGLTPRRGR